MRRSLDSGIRLAVFDWAGTLVDHGGLAHVEAMIAAFETVGVCVSAAQVRWATRGRVREQIEHLLRVPHILRAFERAHGHSPRERDRETIYRSLQAAQHSAIERHATLIDGALGCIGYMRERGIAITTITDCEPTAHELLVARAAAQGLNPDYCASCEAPVAGGSEPFQILSCMERFGIKRPREVLLVAGAARQIEASGHVGCISVGVASSGEEVGLSGQAFAQLELREQNALLAHAHRSLREVHASFVVDTMLELPLVLERLAQRRLSPAA